MVDMTLFPTGLTYSRNTKAPLESDRIFNSLEAAQAYVNNPDQNSYVGLTVAITEDPDPSKNGLYYISKVAQSSGEVGVLEKLGTTSITGDIAEDVEQLQNEVVQLGSKVDNIKVKDVDPSESHGISLKLSEGVVGVSVDMVTLADDIISKHKVNASNIKLGNNIGTEANPDRYTTEDNVQGVLESINARIESVDADIQSALEGGVTGIEQGNGISVDSSVATKPKVSVKVAPYGGLSLNANGLAVSVVEGGAIVNTKDGLNIQWSEF